MNFLEALEKLKNGECEGICPDGGFNNVFIIGHHNRLMCKSNKGGLNLLGGTYLGDWILVKPKPVYRAQEIQFYFNTKTKEIQKIYPNTPLPKLSSDWVLMTGMQKVEVKQPVKKTYKFLLSQTTCTPSGLGNYKISGTAEIEPDKDKIVKNMTLTINWEEHEKEDKLTDEISSSNLPIEKSIIQTTIDGPNKNKVMSQYFKNRAVGDL